MGSAEPAAGVDDPLHQIAPSLGRDALSGRLERALAGLEGDVGPSAAWQRAWMLTAVGRYGDALEACAEAMAGPPLVQASARMAEAMLYRQVALHARAEDADADALRILRASRSTSASIRAAIRVGQVADAIGLGMPDPVLSRRLRVAAAAVTTAGSWRQRVRLTWVRGQVAMVRGSHGQAARVYAVGARIAADQGARRHESKSLIFLAASRAAMGEDAESRRIVMRGLQLAARCGAAPLLWPAELVLADVDAAAAAAHRERARQVARGLLDSLPAALREEAAARPLASRLLGDDPSAAATPAAHPVPTDA